MFTNEETLQRWREKFRGDLPWAPRCIYCRHLTITVHDWCKMLDEEIDRPVFSVCPGFQIHKALEPSP